MIDAIASPWLPNAMFVLVTAFARLICENWFAPAASVGLVWSYRENRQSPNISPSSHIIEVPSL